MPGFFTRRSHYELKLREIENFLNSGEKEKASTAADTLINETSGVTILLYHDIALNQNQYSISPETFARHLDIISNLNIPVISMHDVKAAKEKYERALIISFDDAREGVGRYAVPLLKEYHFPYIIYVAPGYIDQPGQILPSEKFSSFLSWNEIEELASDGALIGSHTMTHPNLNTLSPVDYTREICDSKINLEQRFGPIKHFAYPFGKFTQEIEDTVKSTGYETSATILTGVNGRDSSLFRLKRNLILRMINDRDFTFLCDPVEIREKAKAIIDK